jgi:RHS repeat-associated protein
MQAVYNSSGLQYYRHADWLGSSRFATKPDGTVYFDGAYAPFGENYVETGTTDRSFTGQTQDTMVGLYDFLFRQYASSEGRWLVPDPAGLAAVDITNPQTWNKYAYVGNNPLNSIDPLGLYCAISADGGTFRGCQQGAAGFWWGSGVFEMLSLSVYDTSVAPQLSSTSISITYDPNQIGYPNDQPQTITSQMVGLSYALLPNSTGMFFLSNNSAYLTAGSGTNGSGGSGRPANNGPAHTAVAGSFTLPIAPGIVFAIPWAVIPSTGRICVGAGGGFGSPGVNGGVVRSSQNVESVVSGPSVSVAGQSGYWGGQWIHNTSGIAAGNSMGSPGFRSR